MLKSEIVIIGGHDEQTSVTQMYHERGSGGENSQPLGNFLKK